MQKQVGQQRANHTPLRRSRPAEQVSRPPTSQAPSTSVRYTATPTGTACASAPRAAEVPNRCCRRTPRHTTHHQHFPERVTITRPHHPFHGQSLEVLRQARMRGRLEFVLILPDGSKSLIPADWTDFQIPSCAPQAPASARWMTCCVFATSLMLCWAAPRNRQ